MMVRFNIRHFVLLFGLAGVLSCTDPITVGSDLLGGDRASIGFNATVPIDLRTFVEDSVQAFDVAANRDIGSAFFGSVEDPVFGRSERGLYLIPELQRSSASGLILRPQFAGTDTVDIDSVVVVLPLDTALLYGTALSQSLPYEVRELLMGPDFSEDIFSNAEYPVQSMSISTGAFSPTKEATLVHDTMIIDSVTTPHLRINLDRSFADRFLNADTSIYQSDSTLRDFFPGLNIQPSAVSNGLFGIRATSGFAGVYFYVSTSNRNPSFHIMPLELTVPTYRFNRAGSLSETILDQAVNNEQALVQGGGGLTAVVEITDVNSLADKVINFAELEIYLDEIEGYDYNVFAPAQNVALFYPDSDGQLLPILDEQTILGNTGTDVRQFFLGGNLETDEDSGRLVYRVNLSVHLQSIVDGDISPLVYIRANPQSTDMGRSVLLGPESATFPMKLKVAFTEF